MRFIDWFAGIGGFRRGMELAGHECVGYCEFDRFASASYRSMHTITEEQREYLETFDLKKRQKEIMKEKYLNGEWYADDVRTVNASDIPASDCWCFGFPCQDISVAGKQVGFYGNRSSLFFRIMYLLGQQEEEKKPSYLFIENVKNLLSVNRGWDFARLLVEMDRGGYDAEWSVLNSKDYGVPQNRERCFIIGHLRGRSTSKVFPVERTDRKDNICGSGLGGVCIPCITPDRAEKRQNGRRFKEDGEPSFTLTGVDRHGMAVEVRPMEMSGNRVMESEEVAHTLNCSDQRKFFGANQRRTMVGYNTTREIGGGYNPDLEMLTGERLQRTCREAGNDSGNDVFAIDKGIKPEERQVANCIEAREDRGLSRRKQEGTLICCKISECCEVYGQSMEKQSERSTKLEKSKSADTHFCKSK